MNKIQTILSQTKLVLPTLMLLASYLTCSGQTSHFAVINDPDGYTNVRNNDNSIIDKIASNKLVYCYESNNNESKLVDVEYSRSGINDYGNIHRSRLKFLSDFTSIPLLKVTDKEATFEKNNIKVILKEKPFEQHESYFNYDKEGGQILMMNDEKIWGVETERPQREYSAIDIYIGPQLYQLPKSAYSNVLEPNLSETQIYYNGDKSTLYICALNGDGAGGYFVVWTICNGIYIDRFTLHGF